MAGNRVRLYGPGIRAEMKSDAMHRLVQEAAEGVAERVRDLGITVGDRDGGKHEYPLPVRVSVTTTDRAHATVTLNHPAGIAVQAKHGALSKAAAAEGLEVRSD